MKILFYDTKSYDKDSFEQQRRNFSDIQIDYLKADLAPDTAPLARGYDAVCAFVNSNIGTETVQTLHECGVRGILMRCAGFNNVDMETAQQCGIKVLRVPGYSPEAVAEYAMGLALVACRRMHKAYVRVRENDFSLNGLMGYNFYQKTAGIIGTGRIGAAMARICQGVWHAGGGVRYVSKPGSGLCGISAPGSAAGAKRSDLFTLPADRRNVSYDQQPDHP